jgi:hypothetical protein
MGTHRTISGDQCNWVALTDGHSDTSDQKDPRLAICVPVGQFSQMPERHIGDSACRDCSDDPPALFDLGRRDREDAHTVFFTELHGQLPRYALMKFALY